MKNLLNWISYEAESFSKAGINGCSGEEAAKNAPSILFYSSYNNAINTSQKVFNEDGISNRMNFNANMKTNSVVSGDFFTSGSTGIAAIYDVGGNEFRIHTWKLKTRPWKMEYFGAGGNWIQCLLYSFGNVYKTTENNFSGQLVFSGSSSSINTTIAIEFLTSGVYLLKIFNNKLNELTKIVKQ